MTSASVNVANSSASARRTASTASYGSGPSAMSGTAVPQHPSFANCANWSFTQGS